MVSFSTVPQPPVESETLEGQLKKGAGEAAGRNGGGQVSLIAAELNPGPGWLCLAPEKAAKGEPPDKAEAAEGAALFLQIPPTHSDRTHPSCRSSCSDLAATPDQSSLNLNLELQNSKFLVTLCSRPFPLPTALPRLLAPVLPLGLPLSSPWPSALKLLLSPSLQFAHHPTLPKTTGCSRRKGVLNFSPFECHRGVSHQPLLVSQQLPGHQSLIGLVSI